MVYILQTFGILSLQRTVVHQKHPTGLCEHCGEEESVEHVICACQKYTNEREIMKMNLERWEWIN